MFFSFKFEVVFFLNISIVFSRFSKSAKILDDSYCNLLSRRALLASFHHRQRRFFSSDHKFSVSKNTRSTKALLIELANIFPTSFESSVKLFFFEQLYPHYARS